LQRAAGDGNHQEELLTALPAQQADPEQLAIENERKSRLRRVLAHLDARERLLIRLRFEEGVTLNQIAKLLDLGNAQRVDRLIQEILTRLRKGIDT
jgi:RNA polymerase sigma factor (sigma-70 family)